MMYSKEYTSLSEFMALEAMKEATKKHSFKTYKAGTKVTWHYRSAIGHGTITGVHKLGTSNANTMYSIRQSDHHKGEPDIVYHSGAVLTVVSSF